VEPTLLIPETLHEELVQWVSAGYPFEICGLLVGRKSGSQCEVVRVTQARNLNLERAADRYELDPKDFLAADIAARSTGLDIVGVWHSHPDHPACPSETDHAAAWPEWFYVILSVTRDGVQEFRSWRLNEDHFKEEDIVLCRP
jgi:proteasome lid subunit RPN8/RPN11